MGKSELIRKFLAFYHRVSYRLFVNFSSEERWMLLMGKQMGWDCLKKKNFLELLLREVCSVFTPLPWTQRHWIFSVAKSSLSNGIFYMHHPWRTNERQGIDYSIGYPMHRATDVCQVTLAYLADFDFVNNKNRESIFRRSNRSQPIPT